MRTFIKRNLAQEATSTLSRPTIYGSTIFNKRKTQIPFLIVIAFFLLGFQSVTFANDFNNSIISYSDISLSNQIDKEVDNLDSFNNFNLYMSDTDPNSGETRITVLDFVVGEVIADRSFYFKKVVYTDPDEVYKTVIIKVKLGKVLFKVVFNNWLFDTLIN